jgi:glycosyltransferase involved in cell wall biosynthesis
MKKIINKIKSILRKLKKFVFQPTIKDKDKLSNYYRDSFKKNDLIIFDDFLPNPLGSWRSTEIGFYLKEYPNSILVCLMHSYTSEEKFIQDKKLFIEKFKISNERIFKTGDKVNINTKLAYCLFYNNLKAIYPILKEFQIPFIFTLFPGGGFGFYDNDCDLFLKEINDSPLLKGVIVTQQCVYDYLIDRKIFKKEVLHLLYGACFPINEYTSTFLKKYYSRDKSTLDVCFVAAKYTDAGLDKGFDLFCQVAFKLHKRYNFVKFHVVGNFSKDDLLFDIPEDVIFFYGLQNFNWFPEFYYNKDIFISPVRPYILKKGAFDGFPTGAAIDAGFYEVAVISSDSFNDNCLPGFENWKEIIITETNWYSIMEIIERLIANPQMIASIGSASRKKFLEVFRNENTINKRSEIIKNALRDNNDQRN